MFAAASATLTAVGCEEIIPIDVEAAAEIIVTAAAVAETPIDAAAAPCVVSGSPYSPEVKTPEPYVERKAISWP
tara:strand:- start:197 stop:418 length:222 start_codon:yes stop_codon:yes gene_type:complete